MRRVLAAACRAHSGRRQTRRRAGQREVSSRNERFLNKNYSPLARNRPFGGFLHYANTALHVGKPPQPRHFYCRAIFWDISLPVGVCSPVFPW